MIVLGLLKAGSLMRFVSNAVMRGFLTGVALTIILGQIPKFLGSTSAYENKLVAAADVALSPARFDWTTVFIGVFTMGVVLALEYTPVKRFAMVIALVLATAGTALLELATVLVRDVSPIPQGFPTPVLAGPGDGVRALCGRDLGRAHRAHPGSGREQVHSQPRRDVPGSLA